LTPPADGAVPPQPTPSPPPPPPMPPSPSSPPATVIPKPSRSDLSEQRQHQQDLSRSSDSINDQQWHMVSSNRGLRKGTTTTPNRRETTDESQTTNKTNKITSNNPGKNSSYIYINNMCCAQFCISLLLCLYILTLLFNLILLYMCLLLFVLFRISFFYRKSSVGTIIIIPHTCLCF